MRTFPATLWQDLFWYFLSDPSNALEGSERPGAEAPGLSVASYSLRIGNRVFNHIAANGKDHIKQLSLTCLVKGAIADIHSGSTPRGGVLIPVALQLDNSRVTGLSAGGVNGSINCACQHIGMVTGADTCGGGAAHSNDFGVSGDVDGC